MLIRFLLYLLQKLDYEEMVIPKEVHEIADAMRPMVRRLDTTPHSGEWKKHQVYATALKWYPSISKRDVSLAIELAVRESI